MTQVIVIAGSSLVTFAAIVLFYYHHVQGWATSRRIRHLVLGMMLGIGASLLMLYPVDLASNVTYNTRPMFMAFAGLLAGWVGAGTALIFAIATRISIAGPDMEVGVLVLGMAAGLGVLGHVFLMKSRLRSSWSWAIIGGTLSISVSLFWVLILPNQVPIQVLRETVPILVIASVIGAAGVGYLITSVRDVVDNRQHAMTQSRIDELTGVLNRRGLSVEYHSCMLQERQAGVALLTIDLDHFKLVNDSFGHVVGDRLLRLIADQISQLVPKEDIVARIGGDEFVVVLTNTTQEEAESTAKRLCQVVSDCHMVPETVKLLNGANEMVTVSIGMAFTRTRHKRLEDLLEKSDRLLYSAKRNGRGHVVAADVASIDE